MGPNPGIVATGCVGCVLRTRHARTLTHARTHAHIKHTQSLSPSLSLPQVAVKVQRPGVLETVTIDLYIIRKLGMFLKRFPQVGQGEGGCVGLLVGKSAGGKGACLSCISRRLVGGSLPSGGGWRMLALCGRFGAAPRGHE